VKHFWYKDFVKEILTGKPEVTDLMQKLFDTTSHRDWSRWIWWFLRELRSFEISL